MRESCISLLHGRIAFSPIGSDPVVWSSPVLAEGVISYMSGVKDKRDLLVQSTTHRSRCLLPAMVPGGDGRRRLPQRQDDSALVVS